MTTYDNVGRAEHPSTCPSCNNPINVGDPVARPDPFGGWIHRDCFLTPVINLARERFNKELKKLKLQYRATNGEDITV